jgi:RNA polymerase sigma factor for flagellar operon FliA
VYNRRGTVDRSLLFEQFYPLVRRLAYQIGQRLPPNVEIDDLIQVGTIGLMQAIEKYTPAEGDHFEAYAASRIRGAIMDELREQDTMSRSLRKVQRQIEQATQLLEHELGRKPTLAECAKALEMSLDEYQEAVTAINSGQVMFIEDMAEEDGEGMSIVEKLVVLRHDQMDVLEHEEFKRTLTGFIEALPEREKMTLSLYYEHDMTLREIGAVLGVNESRVSQIHSAVLKTLRENIRQWTQAQEILSR